MCTCLHIVYQILFLKFSHDYMIMCATDGKLIVDISCSNVNDSLKI
jgi:hypothetical protein